MHIRNFRNGTIWEVFEEERPKPIPYRGRFDGFHALPASVSKTCLVRFDNNKYSVSASAVGRPVDIHAYADRIAIRQDGRIVGEHRRSRRGETVYDPRHYVPVLARKPGSSAQRRAVQGLGAADGAGPRAAASWPGPTTATGRCRKPRRRAHRWIGRSRRGGGPRRRRWRASIPLTSSSTSPRVSAILDQRRQS